MNNKRPPIADKELFRLWYEFYRLALESDDKEIKRAVRASRAFYAPWRVDLAEQFDPWWAKHRHLFEQSAFVRIVESGEAGREGVVTLEIPLSKTKAEAIREIREVLRDLLSAKPPQTSQASSYLPTEVRGVKRDALRIMLDLERRIFRNQRLEGKALRDRVQRFFEAERYKRKANRVPAAFRIDTYSDTTDNVDRNIRRYRQKARQLVLNVARGVFPGSY